MMPYAPSIQHDTPKSGSIDHTKQLRDHANRLIEMLRAAKQETEERLDADEREDAMASVRGISSLDIAIEDALHTRDILDRALSHTP